MDHDLPSNAAECVRHLSAMVDQVQDYAIFCMDPSGIILTWNPAAQTMKGYPSLEAIGMHFEMLYTPEDRRDGKPAGNLARANEQGTFQEEGWRLKKDGTRFWALAEIIALKNADGAVTAFYKITRDITRRRALAEQLNLERERAQITLAAITDAVISSDAQGRIDFMNERAEELTGMYAADARGKSLSEVVRLQHQDGSAPAIEANSRAPTSSLLARLDGVTREVEHVCAAIKLPDGTHAGDVLVIRDISHLRRVEKELKHADRRKDEFLAMLAHELRNPLSPISAAADLLAMGRLDASGVQRTSQVIGRQVRHMTSLIDDLLDVSRVTRGLVVLDKVDLDCKSVVSDALEQARPLLESRTHHVTIALAPEDAVISGDKKRMVQVIANLLTNAAKYTPAGGNIVLGMSVSTTRVTIFVQDDGIGMDADLVERAFQMFTQAQRSSDRTQGGLGLGLALVRSLIELHGGTVAACSKGPGAGSTFTVDLPRLVQPAAQAIHDGGLNVESQTTADAMRILVVDDNVDAAQLLAEYLQAFGHVVAVENHPHCALEIADSFAPDACLLDIGLPDMDGLELVRRLAPSLPGALFIAVTGYGQPRDVSAAAEAGFHHHFVKPVDKERLMAALHAKGPGTAPVDAGSPRRSLPTV